MILIVLIMVCPVGMMRWSEMMMWTDCYVRSDGMTGLC
jgi:hypothetical protein